MNKEAITELFKSFEKSFLNILSSDKPQEQTLTPVIKQFDEELMESIEVLYCAPLEVDAHDEGMNEEEIRKMVDNFNTNIHKIKGNIGHVVNTEKFSATKAWVNECECTIGDQIVKEGTPLVKLKFHDPVLWQQRKDGIFAGISMGAQGIREEVEN